MGQCYSCGTQLTLREEESNCDTCGVVLKYNCWSCSHTMYVKDKKTKQTLNLCSVCGFYYCPHCDICDKHCEKNEWINFFTPILHDIKKSHVTVSDVMKMIILYIEDIKFSVEKRVCHKGVPISYATQRIKEILVRMQGFKTKDNFDKAAFQRRYDKIKNMQIGDTTTVGELKEAGSLGFETRDVVNLAICRGLLKKIGYTSKDGKRKHYFERVNEKVCVHFCESDLIINQCVKCKKNQPLTYTHCPNCTYTNNTKNHSRGNSYECKKKTNNKHTCQMGRSSFSKVKK